MKEIRICSETDYPRWDAYVSGHPRATPFHRIAWLNVVRNTYGHHPTYLMALNNHDVVGVLPLFRITRPGKRTIVASGAFTSYDGVLGEDPDVEMALMEKAAEFATSEHARWLEVKNTSRYQRGNANWHVLGDYCTMIVPLHQGESGVWAGLNKSTRRNIRRSERHSIHVDSGHQGLDDFYALELLTMRRHGTPVHSKQFYANILCEFQDQATVFVAKRKGSSIAAKMVLTLGDRMYSLAAASSSFCREYRCNDLVNWRVLQHASGNGFASFDFGRSVWNSGTFEFKKRMGALAEPLYYHYSVAEGESPPSLPQKSGFLKVASTAWSWLPLPVTALLGPKLIRYIP
jgi:FemAB-related protein (PEP-CTERM system-associated)